jgi:serine/threonine-protein kinase HipA
VIDFSRKIRSLDVRVDRELAGTLTRSSQYEFQYGEGAQQPVSLIMPVEDRTFTDGELFAAMDMNLPEGFLLARLREHSPKSAPTKMHLLALMGANGIGRLAYRLPGESPPANPVGVDRARILRDGAGKDGAIFQELVNAYLATGSGLSGVQPKIVLPERGRLPIPNLIVKFGGAAYPGIAANEYLCLQAARRAQLNVPGHELSDDGSLLIVERFDLRAEGTRLGFEDIAALIDLRVGGALSDRKYVGSYERVTDVLADFVTDTAQAQEQFFDYVALTAMLRNGDGHLKNFGVLYDDERVWLAPVYDVLTTTIYPYERNIGEQVTDRTMALKLRVGQKARPYPQRGELVAFGDEVCHVRRPQERIERIAQALDETLADAEGDDRIPKSTLAAMGKEWRDAVFAYAPD